MIQKDLLVTIINWLYYGLVINVKKCEFMKQELVYLGFIVGARKLKVDLEKVQVINQWPTPRLVTEVQSFIGACQYLRNFIRHFSLIVLVSNYA